MIWENVQLVMILTLSGDWTLALSTESTVIVIFPGIDRGSEISSSFMWAKASGPEHVTQSNCFSWKMINLKLLFVGVR